MFFPRSIIWQEKFRLGRYVWRSLAWFFVCISSCALAQDFSGNSAQSAPGKLGPGKLDPGPDPSKPNDSTIEFRTADLASVDQLVLVLSNATDPKGNRQEVLVFLGRTKNRGWETMGVSNGDELSQHWRGVAKRQLEPYQQVGLNSEQLEKVNLAVEVSIAQFQRLYLELRNDFLDQPDQKSRLAVLASDDRYEKLRKLGREGLFVEDSLVAKVVNTVLAQPSLPQQQSHSDGFHE